MLNKDTLHSQLISRRTLMLAAGKVGILFLLAGRMFYMQFIKSTEYKTLSDKNRISIIIIPPTRGNIYDRHNIPPSHNQTCFRILLDKNANKNYPVEFETLRKILELSDTQSEELINQIRKAHKRVPSIILDNLSWEQVASIEEQSEYLKAFFVDTGYMRYYPYHHDLAHVIGYMGKTEDREQKGSIIDANFKSGTSGIEKFYNSHLQGKFGYKQIELNAYGNFIRSLAHSDSISGKNLELNIDFQIQKEIAKLLDPRGASAIVMSCIDGGIIAMNSSPSFDPNNFNKLSTLYWQEITSNPYKPLINKAIQSLYPPGSIFKIITALAALDYGISAHETHFCAAGASATKENRFRCAKKSGHGSVNMIDALKHSCNSYIYAIAKQIGADRIINMARRFGFGEKTKIDLHGEVAGFVPDKLWKQRKLGKIWTVGDTLNLSIGQGFLLCTPLQIARMITAIATKGKLFVPSIAKADPVYQNIGLKTEYFDIVHAALYNCVNEGGTGYNARMYGKIKSAGKTGTAQVQAKKNALDDLSANTVAWHKRNHGIFSGFVPHNNPEYVVSVYYDHGGGGAIGAAPIAGKIFRVLYNRASPEEDKS